MAENGIDPDTGKPRNNYKYWNAKLYDDGNWTAEWGRVGCENPDSGTWNESKKTMDSVVIVFYILIGLLTTANLPGWVRIGPSATTLSLT